MPVSTHHPRRVRRAAVGLVAAVGLLLPLGACTSSSEPAPSAGETPAGTAPAQTLRSSEVRLQTRVTRVAGRLPSGHRARVAKGTGRVVERYLATAYLRDYPMRAPGRSFAGFTPGARKQAMRDQRLLTGRGLKGAESVSFTDAAAYVAVLAPRRHVVGATARLEADLRVETARGSEKVRIRGRLMLTPTTKGWRIFGYDLARSDLAQDKKAGTKNAGKKKAGGAS